jgi:hypothetical protein
VLHGDGVPWLEELPAVRRLALSEHGLISRASALQAGMGGDDVVRMVRQGLWVPVRRGWYVHRDHWEALDERVGRPRALILASHLSLSRRHAVSHSSAANLLDLPTLRARDGLVHVTKAGAPRARVRHGIKHHQATYAPEQVVMRFGAPVLDLARTALDIGREFGFVHGVCAVDSARQLGVSLTDLEAALAAMWQWPNVRAARAALDFSDPGAESLGESMSRILIDEAGLGPIQTQFEIRDDGRSARCDLRVGRQLYEFDGYVKYHRPEAGGLATRSADEVVWAEKQRQDWLAGFELGMSRIVWSDLWGDRRAPTIVRLQREHAATTARYGTSIDELEPYIVRRRT